MKKYLIIFLGIFCFANLSANENVELLTDSASNYYLEADYDNALRIYNQLHNEGYSSPELYYNIGNSYFKTGRIADAIYFYEKALILKPNDKDVKHNLNVANSHTRNKVEQMPEVFYVTWYRNFTSIMNSNSWALTSIVLFVSSLIMAGLFLFSKRIAFRKTGFILGIIFLIVSIFSLVFSLGQARKITDNPNAIVFQSSMVKSSPSNESINLFEINEGLKVEITDSINSWINIRLSDGKEGWIPYINVKKL